MEKPLIAKLQLHQKGERRGRANLAKASKLQVSHTEGKTTLAVGLSTGENTVPRGIK